MIFLTALSDTAHKVEAFDAGGVDFVTKPFRGEEILARVKTHVALRRSQGLMDRDRRIDVDSAGAVEVNCDGALVRRIMENLVSNGIRHTPAGSPLRIAIANRDGRARVAVHDTGVGVPAQAREKIFEKFGTLVTSHEGTYHSTGVGLAFCKLAIEAQGGVIGVDPGVPVGSVFWFGLPA